MSGHGGLRVVPLTAGLEPEANPDLAGDPILREDYVGFRNALVRVLQSFGTVGPVGELPIVDDWNGAASKREVGSCDPDFYVAPDPWNVCDRCVEVGLTGFTAPLVHSVAKLAALWPGWCVYLVFMRGALTIFGDRVLYEGSQFAGSSSIEDLETRLASNQTSLGR